MPSDQHNIPFFSGLESISCFILGWCIVDTYGYVSSFLVGWQRNSRSSQGGSWSFKHLLNDPFEVKTGEVGSFVSSQKTDHFVLIGDIEPPLDIARNRFWISL